MILAAKEHKTDMSKLICVINSIFFLGDLFFICLHFLLNLDICLSAKIGLHEQKNIWPTSSRISKVQIMQQRPDKSTSLETEVLNRLNIFIFYTNITKAVIKTYDKKYQQK